MAKKRGVSSKTHTQKQLDDYANQHNPNNKAYQARVANDKKTKKNVVNSNAKKQAKKWAKFEHELGLDADLEWYCYSNPYDFD